MRHMNRYAHVPHLTRELKQLLPENSFASLLWRTIGSELEYRLTDWPDEREIGFSSLFPVEALFIWISKNGGLDPAWLAEKNGRYLDDDGKLISPTVKRSYSGVEQLAAYGLWLICEEMECCGPLTEQVWDEQGLSPNGWTQDEVLNHQAECLLLAYQALAYAQRMLLGTPLSSEESEKAAQFDFATLGRAGAEKRHAPMRKLKSWTLDQCEAGKWQHATEAASALESRVIAYGRTIGADLAPTNAHRTISKWIREMTNEKS